MDVRRDDSRFSRIETWTWAGMSGDEGPDCREEPSASPLYNHLVVRLHDYNAPVQIETPDESGPSGS
ncbi:MAG: hypothetical protein WD645_06255 [Dehalococcoidia bacterium]